jgi:hypothetical protein
MPELKLEVVSSMPNHHNIEIHLVGGASVQADASPVLRVGDTVSFSSPDGKVRVLFPSGSPYGVSEIHNAHVHAVKTPGTFQYLCFITPTGKTEEIGWSLTNPNAGGENKVLP